MKIYLLFVLIACGYLLAAFGKFGIFILELLEIPINAALKILNRGNTL